MIKTLVPVVKILEIVELRKKKAKWTVIASTTGIERRIAKREYELWIKYREIERVEHLEGYKCGYRDGYRDAMKDRSK